MQPKSALYWIPLFFINNSPMSLFGSSHRHKHEKETYNITINENITINCGEPRRQNVRLFLTTNINKSNTNLLIMALQLNQG